MVHRIASASIAGWVASFAGAAWSAPDPYPDTRREWAQSAPSAEAPVPDRPFDQVELVAAVLARNPSVEAAHRGWQQALARPAQARALEDPMLGGSFAPLSLFGGEPMPAAHGAEPRPVEFGFSVELVQRLPFPGKRALGAARATAEAEAAGSDFAVVRLDLALAASELLFDRWRVERALDINRRSAALVAELASASAAQHRAGRANQEDQWLAEIAAARVEEERIGLQAEAAVLDARMNGLLHRAPEAPLPPPAPPPDPPSLMPPLSFFMAAGKRHRPEVAATAARVRAGAAAIASAERERWPDLQLSAGYNAMWDMPEHRFMLGLGVNLPVQTGRRDAAEEEASAGFRARQAEAERVARSVEVEVVAAYRQVEASARTLDLYGGRLLPAASGRRAAAEAGLATGESSLSAVLEAERDERQMELSFELARAAARKRWAGLERAAGMLPGGDR